LIQKEVGDLNYNECVIDSIVYGHFVCSAYSKVAYDVSLDDKLLSNNKKQL